MPEYTALGKFDKLHCFVVVIVSEMSLCCLAGTLLNAHHPTLRLWGLLLLIKFS